MRKRIVAEISTTWPKEEVRPIGIIAGKFQVVISSNAKQGYTLESWQLSVTPTQMVQVVPPLSVADCSIVETIVAAKGSRRFSCLISIKRRDEWRDFQANL